MGIISPSRLYYFSCCYRVCFKISKFFIEKSIISQCLTDSNEYEITDAEYERAVKITRVVLDAVTE